MAGQGSSKYHQPTGTTNPVYNVHISYPLNDNSSKEIRDNILIDFFGYNEGDIKALDEQQKGYFTISDKRHPGKWATGAEMINWSFNTDRTVQIEMPQKLIDGLNSIREQRASFEAFKVGMFISDAAIRKHITDDLENILLASGARRLTGLDDLMATITTKQTSRDEIYKALRFLTNESGYKGNPFLLIALAATTCSKSDTPVFRYPEVTEAVIAAAVKAANDSLYRNSKTSYSTINTQEAARVNLWGATLYDNINNNEGTLNRRRIERLLSMSDTERRSLIEGDEIDLIASGQTAVRSPSSSEKQLRNLKENWKQRQQMEQGINEIGNEIPPTDPKYDEYYYKPQDRIEIKDAVIPQKQRVMADGKKRSPVKTVSLSRPVNKLGAETDWAGNPVTLLLEEWRYMAADRRMAELAAYSEKRRQLSRRIQYEETIIIPPRPEIIAQAIIDVRRFGRITRQPLIKLGIFYTLTDLENLLEESNAFYQIRK